MSGRFAALIAVLGARCRSDINAITGVHRRGTARLRNLQARHLRRGRVPTRNETDVKGFRAGRVVVEAIRFLRCARAWIVVCVALEKDDCVPRLNVAWSCSHAPLDLSVLLKRARQHSRRALFRGDNSVSVGLPKPQKLATNNGAISLYRSRNLVPRRQGNDLMPAACEHGIGQAHSRERAHVRACGSPSGLG